MHNRRKSLRRAVCCDSNSNSGISAERRIHESLATPYPHDAHEIRALYPTDDPEGREVQFAQQRAVELRRHGPALREDLELLNVFDDRGHKALTGLRHDLRFVPSDDGGLARNHPYNDGNKRVAFVVMAVFLGLNGLELTGSEADVVTAIVALASGELNEAALADWIRLHTAKRSR